MLFIALGFFLSLLHGHTERLDFESSFSESDGQRYIKISKNRKVHPKQNPDYIQFLWIVLPFRNTS